MHGSPETNQSIPGLSIIILTISHNEPFPVVSTTIALKAIDHVLRPLDGANSDYTCVNSEMLIKE